MDMNNVKMVAMSLFLIAAVTHAHAEVSQLGQAEEGGIVFQLGKSQVLIKISGNVTAEIAGDELILREDKTPPAALSEPSGAVEYTHAEADRQLREMRKK
jgi:hypothetical protein